MINTCINATHNIKAGRSHLCFELIEYSKKIIIKSRDTHCALSNETKFFANKKK